MTTLQTQAPEIQYILNSASDYAVGKDGALISFFDAQDGSVVDATTMVEDFGDIAPFLWVCGDQDFAQKEFKAVSQILQKNILHVNPRRSHPWMVHTYDWTDLLLGLLDYYEISDESLALEMATKILTIWEKSFYREHNVYGQAIKLKNRLYTLPISRLMNVGMFPELLLKYAECQTEKETADRIRGFARSMSLNLTQTDFFKDTGLFPDTIISGNSIKSAIEYAISILTRKQETHNSCTLFKHNTNAIASFLELWLCTKKTIFMDVIEKWTDGLQKHLLTSDNMVAMRWHKDKGILQGPTDHNFQVVDLMCDIYHHTNDQKYLDLAISVADAWIKVQSSIGFMPHHIEGARSKHAMSDSQTDFSVAFLKLGALTGEKKYISAAERIMEAIKKYMYLPCGMATWVDVQTGTPIDTTCKTKFMILSLKGWLALNNQERIYKDEHFTNLLSDR